MADLSVRRHGKPFHVFLRSQASSGYVLLACAVAALVWANSPWSASYFEWLQTSAGFSLGAFGLEKPILLWINDGLMAVFFLLVGLEIKREVLVGELSSPRQAALPIVAAVGGMVVPAAVYLAFNWGTDGARGWGIPMATDIAFSIGVLAILGSRFPVAIRVFLTAFAIVDDMGAVIIIALFYTDHLSLAHLAGAGVALAGLMLCNRFGIRRLWPYLVVGAVLWYFLLKSGVHASIAGVLAAMAVPARVKLDPSAFTRENRALLDEFEGAEPAAGAVQLSEDRHAVVEEIEQSCRDVQMPLQRLEHRLHPMVNFGVMPVFALANAGVALGGGAAMGGGVTSGVALGLVIGKPLGIVLFCFAAERMRMAELPKGVGWRQILGAGFLGGIGFTMSLFIAGLAFDEPARLDQAKVGILAGSLISALLGAAILSGAPRRSRKERRTTTVE